MTIRNKILVYFSTSTILLVGIAIFLIYMLFYAYREEDFQQRQKEKIITSLGFLEHIKETETALIGKLGSLDINNMLDEKLLIFNQDRTLIYASIDDTPISYSSQLVKQLSDKHNWIEQKDGLYDVIGMYIESHGKIYYAISKAYDSFGYAKLNFLKWVLLGTYLFITIAIMLLSFYLSKHISKPIVDITRRIVGYDLEARYIPLVMNAHITEVSTLVVQFNKLMKRMDEAFDFQKHAIHHLSHELKTPIAILVSNFERMEKETNVAHLQAQIAMQKDDTKSLSDIINSLLEIAKAETNTVSKKETIRIDELIFDLVEELSNVYPDFRFTIEYDQINSNIPLEISVNTRLFKSALLNLMHNCVQYSNNQKAKISIITKDHHLQIAFENQGNIIEEQEIPYLFQRFFRGRNSQGKRGFGLGLVFVAKIMHLHGGSVNYRVVDHNTNRFVLSI